MLMKDDKRKMATLIIKKMKDGSDKSMEKPMQEGAEMDSSSDSYSMIADDIMQSLERKDVAALVQSLKAFMQECMSEEDMEESRSEEDKED